MSRSKVNSLTYPVNTGKMGYLWCHTSTSLVTLVHTWTLDNYSHRTEENQESIRSPYFTISGCQNSECFLELYPKGVNEDCKGHTSLYVHHRGNEPGWVTFEMSILNAASEKLHRVNTRRFKFTSGSWGFPKFVKNEQLSVESGLLFNDALTIRVEIFLTKEPLHNGGILNFDVHTKSPKTISVDLKRFYSQQKFWDVAFDVKGTTYKAHKAVLAARSPVFAAMFEDNSSEDESDIVEVPDVRKEVFAEMLNFIYTGKVTTLKTTPVELLRVADKYNIRGLKTLSEAQLCADISIERACEILTFADLYNADHLKALALNFISAHSSNIVLTEGWKQLMQEYPKLFGECATHIASPI